MEGKKIVKIKQFNRIGRQGSFSTMDLSMPMKKVVVKKLSAHMVVMAKTKPSTSTTLNFQNYNLRSKINTSVHRSNLELV